MKRLLVGGGLGLALSALSVLAPSGALASTATPGEVQITMSGFVGTDALTDFPVLVRLSRDRIAQIDWDSVVLAGPDAVAFFDASGNEIPCDVDTWNTDGESLIWVKVPTLASAGDTITMKWGVGLKRTTTSADVWSDYAVVHHFSGAEDSVCTDSSGNGFKATLPSSVSEIQSAKIGNGVYKTSGTIVVDNYASLGLGGTFTASGWFYMEQRTGYESFFNNKTNWNEGNGFSTNMQNDNKKLFYAGAATPTYTDISLSDSVVGRWIYFTIAFYTKDGKNYLVRIYENGKDYADKSATNPGESNLNLQIGGSNLKGFVDEIRIRKSMTWLAWGKNDYATQTDANYCSYELVSNPIAEYGEEPVVTYDGAPSSQAGDTVSIQVPYNVLWGGDEGARADVHALWGTDPENLTDTVVARGVLGTGVGTVDDVKPDTDYYVVLYATNGEKSSDRTVVKPVHAAGQHALLGVSVTSDATTYTVSGTVRPGIGVTTVTLRYSFNSDALDQTKLVCTKEIGDDPAFSCTIEAPQIGDTLHGRIEVVNEWESTTWGRYVFESQTDKASQALTDTTPREWTWLATEPANWQTAENWSASGVTGFPNAAGATAKFDPAGAALTAELTDGVTVKTIKVSDGVTTVKGDGQTLSLGGISYSGGEEAMPTLVLDGVKVEGTVDRSTFLANGRPAGLWVKGGTAITIVTPKGVAENIVKGSRYRASGEGSKIVFRDNTIRWHSGLTSDWEWLAEDGGTIDGQGFMHVGSMDDTRDVRFIAVNGGTVKPGSGLNRTCMEFGGIIVAVTNRGTMAFGAANANPNDGAPCFTCNSRFTIHDGNVTGNINLASNNVVEVTGEGGLSTLGTINYPSYAFGNRIHFTGCTATIGDLTMANGRNNAVIVEDATVTNTSHWIYTWSKSGVPNENHPDANIVFRGTTPNVRVTGSASGVGAVMGWSAPLTDPITLVFEPVGEGFAAAPISVQTMSSMYEYLPIRVDGKKYRGPRQLMPLMTCDKGWKSRPTAEAIEANLPEGALPKDAHLKWSADNKTLCVDMPSRLGFMIFVR